MKRAYWDEGYSPLMGVGHVSTVGPDDPRPEVAAVLWVPDPEQRHGWREKYILKPGAEVAIARPVGFRKP